MKKTALTYARPAKVSFRIWSGCLSLLPDMYHGNTAQVTIAQVTVVPFPRYAPLVQAIHTRQRVEGRKEGHPMATDRRTFLPLLALGVPAAARALTQVSTPAIPSRALIDEDGEYPSASLMELVPGVRQHLWEAFLRCNLSMRVARDTPSDCPPGKIRWAIEMEESDGSSASILGTHPTVLLVSCSKSLQTLYTICLEQAGCKVESAWRDDVVMRLYREHGPYDLVLIHFFRFKDLSDRIRERNPEQAIAIMGPCSTMNVRMHYKVPVLREGFRQEKLVSLVESAIKPRARILLVAGEYCSLSDSLLNYVSTFELEVESTGEDAFRRYRENGPYDVVLTGFEFVPPYWHESRQSVEMNGSDLARAIRRENPTQHIAMITDERSPAVRRSVQRELGDIPLLRAEELLDAIEKRRDEGLASEGEVLLAAADRVIARKLKRLRKTAKLKEEITA
jgi:CheY-like chemotaxis protein